MTKTLTHFKLLFFMLGEKLMKNNTLNDANFDYYYSAIL